MPVVRTVGRSVACSRRSDSGERCEVKRSAKKIKAREEAYGQVTTKISRMGSLPNFLTHSAPFRARGAPLLVDYPPPRGGGGWATLKLLEALAACEKKRLVAGVGIPISLVGWFSNRTANWVPEVAFSPFRVLSRRQQTFPFCCLISLVIWGTGTGKAKTLKFPNGDIGWPVCTDPDHCAPVLWVSVYGGGLETNKDGGV